MYFRISSLTSQTRGLSRPSFLSIRRAPFRSRPAPPSTALSRCPLQRNATPLRGGSTRASCGSGTSTDHSTGNTGSKGTDNIGGSATGSVGTANSASVAAEIPIASGRESSSESKPTRRCPANTAAAAAGTTGRGRRCVKHKRRRCCCRRRGGGGGDGGGDGAS